MCACHGTPFARSFVRNAMRSRADTPRPGRSRADSCPATAGSQGCAIVSWTEKGALDEYTDRFISSTPIGSNKTSVGRYSASQTVPNNSYVECRKVENDQMKKARKQTTNTAVATIITRRP